MSTGLIPILTVVHAHIEESRCLIILIDALCTPAFNTSIVADFNVWFKIRQLFCIKTSIGVKQTCTCLVFRTNISH